MSFLSFLNFKRNLLILPHPLQLQLVSEPNSAVIKNISSKQSFVCVEILNIFGKTVLFHMKMVFFLRFHIQWSGVFLSKEVIIKMNRKTNQLQSDTYIIIYVCCLIYGLYSEYAFCKAFKFNIFSTVHQNLRFINTYFTKLYN